MVKKQVRVIFEVVLEVDSDSSMEGILDEAAEVLGSSTIKPYVLCSEDERQILSDEDLREYAEEE